MNDVIREINEIKDRNRRVEIDKAWEQSWTRRLFIATITYVVALWFLQAIDAAIPYFNALVPMGGYILSTLSLPFLKNWWAKRF